MKASFSPVSVLVLNLNGQEHLDECLTSLETLAYPRDRFEIVLVDNGSTDGSLAFVRERFPHVRVIALTENGGFCAPYNAAVRQSKSEFVAFLNNDTRVDPQWLTALVSTADRHGAAAVASTILDWSGQTIDFVGGVTSFIGHSWQLDFREPVRCRTEETPLLFPCAGSALFARTAFLDAGGFDEDFFAYFEDVDLGWRLNLFGEKVVLAPEAVTYHRMHGTSSRWALAQRVRLLERNALAMIYKNYEAATLSRILPAAIGLLLLRALTRSGIDTLNLTMSDRPADVVATNPYLAAHLIGLEDFCRNLPALKRKRAVVQGRRQRPDSSLFSLFVDPLRLHERGGLYEDVARTLIREFDIDELLGVGKMSPVRAAPAPEPQREHVRSPQSGSPQSEPVQGLLPRVSVVILTALGPTHLRACLDALRAQSYPADQVELIVVDNGSGEDPTEAILTRFPGARVIRNDANLGFAAGNNQGAAAARGHYVVFLNDDTRVHPKWLEELVNTARRRAAAAVASYILDWSGTAVDFVEGAVNFQGKGFQLNYGSPADRVAAEEKPLLFACGCAMLIDRAVLSDVGGWDEGAFTYYEDVELGWRLHVLGHDVWFSPRAIVYHRHHGTSEQWPEPPRMRLYERNALRAMFALLETKTLQRALPAALLLAADRALLEAGLSRVSDRRLDAQSRGLSESRYQRLMRATRQALRDRGITRSMSIDQALRRLGIAGILNVVRDVTGLRRASQPRSRRESYFIEHGGVPAGFDAEPQPMPIEAAAMLSGVYAFLADLPQLAERRAAIQRKRQVQDEVILRQFGSHWLTPSSARHQHEHHALHSAIVKEFALDPTVEESGDVTCQPT